MLNLYYSLFKFILLSPLFLIFNNVINPKIKFQKLLNNTIYFSIFVASILLIVLYSFYGLYNIKIPFFSNSISIIFSLNSFNLFFAFAISFSMLFLNIKFQSSFDFLNLSDKYVFYNRGFSFLSLFLILISFSNNISVVFFINIYLLVSIFFIIMNPDLKEFRKNYSIYFCINVISNLILIIISALYLLRTNINIFTIQSNINVDYVSTYWALIVLILLLLINLSGPIFINFKEKFYYEDNLPIFIIYIIPTFFVNLFLFFKILYYIFYNNFNNLGMYFYYAGFYMPILFLGSCFFLIKNIKNNSKFILTLIISVFIVFLSQLLLINTEYELIKIFSNFLILLIISTIIINTYCNILFSLLNNDIIEFSILYSKSKFEINFYMALVSIMIFSLLLSFFDLSLYNFNLLFFINLIEIIILSIIAVTYFIMALKKHSTKSQENKNISENFIKFFSPELISFALFVITLLIKNQIVKYINFYK